MCKSLAPMYAIQVIKEALLVSECDGAFMTVVTSERLFREMSFELVPRPQCSCRESFEAFMTVVECADISLKIRKDMHSSRVSEILFPCVFTNSLPVYPIP
jgi:hypothetical protein